MRKFIPSEVTVTADVVLQVLHAQPCALLCDTVARRAQELGYTGSGRVVATILCELLAAGKVATVVQGDGRTRFMEVTR